MPGRNRPSGNRSQNERVETDLDRIAPIPTKPALFEEGDKVYRFPIHFTIELIDPTKEMDPASTVAADGEEVAG